MNPIVGNYYILNNSIVRCRKLLNATVFLAEYSRDPLLELLEWQCNSKIEREATTDEIYKWKENQIILLNYKITDYTEKINELREEIEKLS